MNETAASARTDYDAICRVERYECTHMTKIYVFSVTAWDTFMS
jgi:hypothetical protein